VADEPGPFRSLLRLADPLLKWLSRIRRVALRLLALFLALWVAFSALPTRLTDFADVSGGSWFGDSVSAVTLRWLESHLLPKGTQVLVLSPFGAFTVLMEIGAAMAAFVTVLVALALLLRWLWPGMRRHERGAAAEVLLMAPALFAGGVALALYVLPTLYAWGIGLEPAAGGTNTVSLTEFVSTTLVFTLGVGLAFEVPVLCSGLAQAGVLTTSLMRKKENAVIAGAGCVVLAFLISPGVGGGVIEFPLAAVFGLLYLLGYWFVGRVERSRERSAARAMGVTVHGEPD
jgi:sec-independent protein translocase protein TatC